MPQINLAGGSHGTVVRYAGTSDEERYEPYPKGGALGIIQHAVRIIENNIYKRNVECNKYFKRLKKGRRFDDVWSDNSIWINYDHRDMGYFGCTNTNNGTDIAIAQYAFKRGLWQVVATLVHELAHTNGAAGAPSTDAEDSLNYCGLGALYDKNCVGVRPGARKQTDEHVV